MARVKMVWIAGFVLAACVDGGPSTAEGPALLTADLVVDDDGVQCPGAAFTSIQAAVNAADDGDTIVVCAGTYPEHVETHKPLTLRGAQAGRDARYRAVSLAEESVVVAADPFWLPSPGVVVDGFYIRETTRCGDDGCDPFPAIETNALTSGSIRNNIVVADTRGMLAGGSGARLEVRRNRFLGAAGVFSGEIGDCCFSEARNVSITSNRFAVSGLAVALMDGAHASVTLSGNTILGGSGVELHDATGVLITRNRMSGGGRFFVLDSVDVRVTSNTVRSAIENAITLSNVGQAQVVDNLIRDGLSHGIDVSHGRLGGLVKDNRVAGCHGVGIWIEDNSAAAVLENETEDNKYGLALVAAPGNLVAWNNVEDNAMVGIVVDPDERTGSIGNLIAGNEVRGNGPPDCRDTTTDGGTSGTGNLWFRNEGSRSIPAGLCVDEVAEPSDCAPPPPDLVSWWPGEANALDVVGANHGTLQGNLDFAPGVVGSAFRLDNTPPSNANVTIGNPQDLQLQDFTIDAWIRLDDFAPTSIAGYTLGTGGYQLGVSFGELSLSKTGVSQVAAPELTITDHAWHHVAVTRSGDTVVFYLDGAASAPRAYAETFEFAGAQFTIGSGSYDGQIDEVEVVARALTHAEVLAIYHAGWRGKCPVQ
jgi:nitrous oxidase accessory protein NosD